MRSHLFLAALVLLLSVSACSSITVESDFDPDVDFTKFTTFRFYKGKPVPGDELNMYPLVKKRFIESVTENLTSKGLTLTEEEGADLVVVLFAGTNQKMQITEWGGYGWYDPWWGPYGGHVSVSYYDQGTAVIDLVDAANKELVWRGLATKAVQRYDNPNEAKEAIDDIVSRILNRYPPY